MQASPETWIFLAGTLLLLSIFGSRLADLLGVPALLTFLGVGMLAGSDGIGGIYFDNPALAQFLGNIALVYILFAGGLSTDSRRIRPVLRAGLTLSSLGVVLTAVTTGLFVQWLLKLDFWEGFLVGAIISSTDTAAVFSVLRSRSVNLRGKLEQMLELEAGSNDPTAVFLTVLGLQMLLSPGQTAGQIILRLVLQLGLGAGIGYLGGRLIPILINRIRLGYDGLYPIISLALALVVYAGAALLGGNGFLAVYLAGIMAGNRTLLHKRSLIRFHDGFAWLMQILMFLTLGLLVFPSRLPGVAGTGLAITLFLMFVARPLSVFISLIGSRASWREQIFIAWVGLRGAVPIILATYPLQAGFQGADFIFNVVFFVVLVSALVQGTSVPQVARWLKLNDPGPRPRTLPLEFNPVDGFTPDLHQICIQPGSRADGQAIMNLEMPEGFLVVMVGRGDEYLLPSGNFVLQAGDQVLAIAEQQIYETTAARLHEPVETT
jgi:cell volume regulation protein A